MVVLTGFVMCGCVYVWVCVCVGFVMCVGVCVCVGGVCNVWVRVCVGFVMCLGVCVCVCVCVGVGFVMRGCVYVWVCVCVSFVMCGYFDNCVRDLVICVLVFTVFCIVCAVFLCWHSSATLTEVFPCFFLSCKANGRV